jgi:excisionase family DNA binding protein
MITMANNERWLSVEEIAAHLGVSKETIYRWLESGKMPAHRMGRLWKFKASEVDAWICAGGAEPHTSDSAARQKNEAGLIGG